MARKWVDSLPFKNVPSEFVVFKPWELITEEDKTELVISFLILLMKS